MTLMTSDKHRQASHFNLTEDYRYNDHSPNWQKLFFQLTKRDVTKKRGAVTFGDASQKSLQRYQVLITHLIALCYGYCHDNSDSYLLDCLRGSLSHCQQFFQFISSLFNLLLFFIDPI